MREERTKGGGSWTEGIGKRGAKEMRERREGNGGGERGRRSELEGEERGGGKCGLWGGR